MMSILHKGGCACGIVRYEISVAPAVSLQCQCRDCQRATGTGHVDAMAFPRDAVRLTGELKYHQVRGDRGGSVSRGFCPSCGAPVMWTFERNPQLCAIVVGSLDDPSVFAPQMVFFASRGYAWDRLDPELPKFDTLPPQMQS
jgi:hypothetical protein